MPSFRPIVRSSGRNKILSDSDSIISNSWEYFSTNWSSSPTQIGSATVSSTAGNVFAYTLNGVTRYRFVPAVYSATLDGFYSTFSSGVLSGLICSRG